MESDKKLYFIALLPPETVRDPITELKSYFKKKYKAGHALKSPPHITLIPPFRWPGAEEKKLIREIEEFSVNEKPFDISLKDFGAFPPRVIYVNVQDNPLLTDLYKRFIVALGKTLDTVKKGRFNPHITLATRDLSRDHFHEAWEEFKNRTFTDAFTIDHITLLKHNGKRWEIFHQALFGKK